MPPRFSWFWGVGTRFWPVLDRAAPCFDLAAGGIGEVFLGSPARLLPGALGRPDHARWLAVPPHLMWRRWRLTIGLSRAGLVAEIRLQHLDAGSPPPATEVDCNGARVRAVDLSTECLERCFGEPAVAGAGAGVQVLEWNRGGSLRFAERRPDGRIIGVGAAALTLPGIAGIDWAP